MSYLGQRISALEAAVAQLQAQGQGEQAQPTYLTVDNQGHVSANFSGTVTATGGVALVETDTPPVTPSSAVVWKDAGVIREFLQGYFNGTAHLIAIEAQPDVNDQAVVNVFATPSGGAGTAGVGITAFDSSGASQSIDIIQSDGRSDFVQLGALGLHVLAAGNFSGTTGGVGNASQAISHGLGGTPTAVLVNVSTTPVSSWSAGSGSGSWTGTQFTASITGPNSTAFTASWLAWL